MAETKQTGQAFAEADRLESGDRIPGFTLPDADGEAVNPHSDHLAGRPVLLVFECLGEGDGSYEEELSSLAARKQDLQDDDVMVMAITRRSCDDNGRLAERYALPFPVLSDPRGRVYGACGFDPATIGCRTVSLALDGNMRVLGAFDGGGASRWPEIAEALQDVTAPTEPSPLTGHPPVLVLPRALTGEDCTELVRVWHRPVPLWDGDGFTTDAYRQEPGDFKVRSSDYGKVTQFVLRDAALQRYLDAKLQRRVIPEILKAFQTKATRREDYRIAGYDAAEGGILGAHRDNTTKETRHRRFTLAVALNDDFEGGGLRFREYSNAGYRIATGTAIVWSCALLHEVLPVTAGRRFILGTHLFGN